MAARRCPTNRDTFPVHDERHLLSSLAVIYGTYADFSTLLLPGPECYCDNSVQNNNGLAPDVNVGCNMPCSANAGETCGGSNRLNAYAAGPGWVQLGCFSDQPYSRTLMNPGSYTGDLTVESCLGSCQASDYVYTGVEYGR